MGSLLAAVGSYLAARAAAGRWLLRIEDLDPVRETPGASDAIQRSLEKHGLYWDSDVCFQHQRLDVYQQVLDSLFERGLVYPCSCSRKELQQLAVRGSCGRVYPGFCRQQPCHRRQEYAWRLVVEGKSVHFFDRRKGHYKQDPVADIGDFVVKRADGFFSYQLAVVVDDAWQGVTEVVRGEDLLDNTPRQIYLQGLLGLTQPQYCHLPLISDGQGNKLSKQTGARALDDRRATENLFAVLACLGYVPPPEMIKAEVTTLLAWALAEKAQAFPSSFV